jgi:hypothetical protein
MCHFTNHPDFVWLLATAVTAASAVWYSIEAPLYLVKSPSCFFHYQFLQWCNSEIKRLVLTSNCSVLKCHTIYNFAILMSWHFHAFSGHVSVTVHLRKLVPLCGHYGISFCQCHVSSLKPFI